MRGGVSRKRIVQISLGLGYSGSAKIAILSTLGFQRVGHEVWFIVAEGSLPERRARALPTEKAAGYRALRKILDELQARRKLVR